MKKMTLSGYKGCDIMRAFMALLHLGWASYIYKLGFLTPDAALA